MDNEGNPEQRCQIASHRIFSLIFRPPTSGTRPGHHSKPITAANSSVLVGVGDIMK